MTGTSTDLYDIADDLQSRGMGRWRRVMLRDWQDARRGGRV